MRVLIYKILLFIVLCGFQAGQNSNQLNGTWNIDEIKLNDSEDSSSQETVLRFLKRSNPTKIQFEITNNKSTYRIYSKDKLLEESAITYTNNKLCKDGVEDCAIVVLSGDSCELIFDVFTYHLSR